MNSCLLVFFSSRYCNETSLALLSYRLILQPLGKYKKSHIGNLFFSPHYRNTGAIQKKKITLSLSFTLQNSAFGDESLDSRLHYGTILSVSSH